MDGSLFLRADNIRPYIVLAKYTTLGTPKRGDPSLRSLARPLPNVTAALGHIGGPFGSLL